MITEDTKLDSPEGIRYLIDWARAHRIVLNAVHRKIAARHGVGIDGVIFSDPMPIHWMTKDEAELMYPKDNGAS